MDEEDYSEPNEMVKSVKELKKSISLFEEYEEVLKEENRKIINILGKHGELVKTFKEAS